MGYRIFPAITQMNNGYISPIMESRSDVQGYAYSLRQTKNAIPLVTGANKNRGGTAYIAGIGQCYLIPFSVNQADSYMLYFKPEGANNTFIGVIKDRKVLLNQGLETTRVGVVAPYVYEDLFDEKGRFLIDYKQKGDIMYLAHKNYPLMKLSRYSWYQWTIENVALQGGPFKDRNTDKTVKLKTSGSVGAVALSSVGIGDSCECIVYPPTMTVSIGANKNIRTWFTVLNTDIDFILDAPTPRAGVLSPLEICTLIKNAIDSAGNPDWGVTIIDSSNNPYLRITANNSELANKDVQVQLSYRISAVINEQDITIVSNSYFGEYTTDEEDFFTPSMVGMPIRLTLENTNVNNVWYTGKEGITEGMIVTSDSAYYKALNAGTCGNVKPTHKEGVVSDGNINWQYLHSGYGYGVITGVVDEYTANFEIKKRLPDEIISQGTYKWELGIIGQGRYPKCLEFFKDRLVLGVEDDGLTKICFSAAGDYENFADMTFGEVLADNAIVLPIFSDLNSINWLCPNGGSLFVGTEGGIVSIGPITASEVLGPNNISYDEVANVGTCRIKPIKISGDILFVGRTGKDIYGLSYNFESDSFEPEEVSLMAEELIESGIKNWCLQYSPDRIIWMCDNKGLLIGLTYNKKQQVRAFHYHETQGQFDNVACIPSPDGDKDEVYFCVNRTDNVSFASVEYLKDGLKVENKNFDDALANAWFLDCGFKHTFDEPTTRITNGLELPVCYLNKEIAIIADGKYIGTKFFGDEAIVLDNPVTTVLFGLPYETIIEPMPINIDLPGKSGQARTQRISSIVVRLYRSCNFKFSYDGKYWREAKLSPENKILSGDYLINWADSNTHINLNDEDIVNATGARMIFKQDLPYPVCFAAFYPQMEVGNG